LLILLNILLRNLIFKFYSKVLYFRVLSFFVVALLHARSRLVSACCKAYDTIILGYYRKKPATENSHLDRFQQTVFGERVSSHQFAQQLQSIDPTLLDFLRRLVTPLKQFDARKYHDNQVKAVVEMVARWHTNSIKGGCLENGVLLKFGNLTGRVHRIASRATHASSDTVAGEQIKVLASTSLHVRRALVESRPEEQRGVVVFDEDNYNKVQVVRGDLVASCSLTMDKYL
jgi:hypothetical protein